MPAFLALLPVAKIGIIGPSTVKVVQGFTVATKIGVATGAARHLEPILWPSEWPDLPHKLHVRAVALEPILAFLLPVWVAAPHAVMTCGVVPRYWSTTRETPVVQGTQAHGTSTHSAMKPNRGSFGSVMTLLRRVWLSTIWRQPLGPEICRKVFSLKEPTGPMITKSPFRSVTVLMMEVQVRVSNASTVTPWVRTPSSLMQPWTLSGWALAD